MQLTVGILTFQMIGVRMTCPYYLRGYSNLCLIHR